MFLGVPTKSAKCPGYFDYLELLEVRLLIIDIKYFLRSSSCFFVFFVFFVPSW